MPQFAIFLLCLGLTFLFTVLLCRKVIPILMQKKLGQKILEIGPRWHKNKEGTPTMGGVCFIPPILIVPLTLCIYLSDTLKTSELRLLILTLIYALANALVGLVDDLTKFKKQQNAGLTPRQKLVLQTTLATAYLAMLNLYGAIQTDIRIPFIEKTVPLGRAFYLLALLLLVGVVNCANLTDGIDGLATSEAAILSGFFAVASVAVASRTLSAVSGAVLGGALAFLLFNYHPARVFMGDTGSLFFGAILSGLAFLIGEPLLIVFAGALYLIEGLSVILQVVYFKLTHGKRLFLMAPLHHHFEKRGWSEVKVVAVFSLCSIALCIATFVAFYRF